jgi:hypothetical protein
MKTAMQEFIEMLKEARSVSIASEDITQTYTNAIRLAESMLDKEKEQIMDAHMEGHYVISYPVSPELEAEQYYNETFRQEK